MSAQTDPYHIFWKSTDTAELLGLLFCCSTLQQFTTGVQKLNYLRAQVTDEAAKSIAGFRLTNINYEHLIALLRERFGQIQKIVNAHMQVLLALPNPSNNITSLHSFHDTIENHIQGPWTVKRLLWCFACPHNTWETTS